MVRHGHFGKDLRARVPVPELRGEDDIKVVAACGGPEERIAGMLGAEAIGNRCGEGEWNIRSTKVVDGLTPDLAEERFSCGRTLGGAIKVALCFEAVEVDYDKAVATFSADSCDVGRRLFRRG
jgi:hypothetical protein